EEFVKLSGVGFRTFAAGAQAAGSHQNIAVTQFAVALIDQQNLGALLASADRGGEAGPAGAGDEDIGICSVHVFLTVGATPCGCPFGGQARGPAPTAVYTPTLSLLRSPSGRRRRR